MRSVAIDAARAAKHAWREHIIDPTARLAQACGADAQTSWALIRPDSYLAARGSSAAALQASLTALQGACA
jgi:hypothetical protein